MDHRNILFTIVNYFKSLTLNSNDLYENLTLKSYENNVLKDCLLKITCWLEQKIEYHVRGKELELRIAIWTHWMLTYSVENMINNNDYTILFWEDGIDWEYIINRKLDYIIDRFCMKNNQYLKNNEHFPIQWLKSKIDSLRKL